MHKLCTQSHSYCFYCCAISYILFWGEIWPECYYEIHIWVPHGHQSQNFHIQQPNGSICLWLCPICPLASPLHILKGSSVNAIESLNSFFCLSNASLTVGRSDIYHCFIVWKHRNIHWHSRICFLHECIMKNSQFLECHSIFFVYVVFYFPVFFYYCKTVWKWHSE